MTKLAAQDKYGSKGTCFGCGPRNEKGLQIKSFWEGDDFVLRYTPKEHHQAFTKVVDGKKVSFVNGGIIGTLLDCHMNWGMATALYHSDHWDRSEGFPSTVTAYFNVQMKKPTPVGVELKVIANVEKLEGRKGFMKARVEVDGDVTVTGDGLFIAVKEDHPAHHRW